MNTVRQGDSLWIDYTLLNWDDIYSTWDSTWEGIFKICLNDLVPVYTGTLTRGDSGVFKLRLNTDSASTEPVLTWESIGLNSYKLMVQITNTTAKYREEHHAPLTVKKQGIS